MEVKVFVIHVRGNTEREEHISREASRNNLSFEFILDGNIEDLTENSLNRYFKDGMAKPSAITSCAYKHFLAYEAVVNNGYPYALILEDDVKLFDLFNDGLSQSLRELSLKAIENVMVSFEYSLNQSVKRKELKPGQMLYPKEFGRFAGLYLIDLNAAASMLKYAKENKCGVPVDWFHNECVSHGALNMYWSYPALGQQFSHNGRMESLIDKGKFGPFRSAIFKLKEVYAYLVNRFF